MTTFAERPFAESVKDAPLIVRGRVGDRSVDWASDAAGAKHIYTFYELRVQEVLKGVLSGKLPRNQLVMRELGGEKDGVGMQVSGASRFEPGEDVVVFLGWPANPDGTFSVYGMMMAKLEVKKDASGREVLSGPALSMGTGHDHGAGERVAGAPESTTTLEDLRQLVRDQGDAPRAVSVAPAAPAPTLPVAPSQSPAAAAPMTQAEVAPSPTPSLAQVPQAPASGWIWLFWMLVGGAAFLGLLRRWFKQSKRG